MQNQLPSEQSNEWEGGDPPCWAHLFEDDESAAPAPSTQVARTDPAPSAAEGSEPIGQQR